MKTVKLVANQFKADQIRCIVAIPSKKKMKRTQWRWEMIGFAPEMRKIKEKRNSADKLSCCACVRICRLANLFLSPTSKKKKRTFLLLMFFFCFLASRVPKKCDFFFSATLFRSGFVAGGGKPETRSEPKKKKKKTKIKKKTR